VKLCFRALAVLLVAPTAAAVGITSAGAQETGLPAGAWVGGVRLSSETVTVLLAIEPGVGETARVRLDIPEVVIEEAEGAEVSPSGLVAWGPAATGDTLRLARAGAALVGRVRWLGGRIDGPGMFVPLSVFTGDSSSEAAFLRALAEGYLGQDGIHAIAVAYARAGDADRARAWLARGLERGMRELVLFRDSALDAVRADPSFRAIFADPTDRHPELSSAVGAIRVERGIRIPMRDGVELVADLVFPVDSDPHPTILVRTPYGRRHETGVYAHFAARGYVVVAQSVRGREDSGGEFVPWLGEREDGADTIDWIAGQGWSNGRVGMIGSSYQAQVQWAAAVEQPEALRCIAPIVSGTDHFFDVPYDYGILKTSMLRWAFMMDTPTPPPEPDVPPDRLLALPLDRLDSAYAGHPIQIWQRWLALDAPAAWGAANFSADIPRITVPVLQISGWWDGESGATDRNWAALGRAGHRLRWLVFGPWGHEIGESTNFADVEYGADAALDLRSLFVRWFDWCLKERPVMEDLPRAQIFVTGANAWRALDDWPDPDAVPIALPMGSAAMLRGTSARGTLGLPTEAGPPDEYRYDPLVVRAEGRIRLDTTTEVDLDPEESDALVYQSAPFAEDTDFAGPGALDLWFSTSARDLDVFALLVDVAPSGEMRAIAQPGKMRMRYLAGWDTPAPLEPGRVYRAEVVLRPFAHRFVVGHRIGLVLRSEWFPLFERNLNTGEPRASATRSEPATVHVYHDPGRPSALRLWRLPD
jgi:putative CocE/NonD family hydrolase